jgi:tRNA(fMet)-specific endonuclease VapC
VERLILDTGVLVRRERQAPLAADVVPEDADIAIAAITASELLVGVELADQARRDARAATVRAIFDAFDIVPFDLDVARHHAALLAHACRAGRPRGAHDLLIAATARATNRVLVTTDRAAFDDLPGVAFRVDPRV